MIPYISFPLFQWKLYYYNNFWRAVSSRIMDVFFLDNNAPIQRARGVTEWFDEDRNNVSHAMAFTFITWQQKDFGRSCQAALSNTIIRTPNEELSFGRMVLCTFSGVPETCAMNAKAYWSLVRWPNILITNFMLLFFSFVTHLQLQTGHIINNISTLVIVLNWICQLLELSLLGAVMFAI